MKTPKPANRTDWGKEHFTCMWPDCGESGLLETHEIIGGDARYKALVEPAAWLRLCKKHHVDLPSKPGREILVRLLAVKLREDPKHYDTGAVVRLNRPNCTEALVGEIEEEVFSVYHSLYGEMPGEEA